MINCIRNAPIITRTIHMDFIIHTDHTAICILTGLVTTATTLACPTITAGDN